MGDTAVDFFLETLKQLITNSKLPLIIGEKHQLQSLEMEIKYLREFLKVTEKKRNEHIEVMNLVMQIRDVVFELENAVDLFVGHAYNQDHLSCWDCFCELFLCKLLCNNKDHLSRDLESVKKEIKTLTAEVKLIYDENMYDINGIEVEHSFTGSSGGGSRSSGGRNTSKVGDEKVVIGFKDEVETLMGKLLDSGVGGRLEIISIIGAGGGGKTTLAREVYDHPLILQKFEIRAWVNISQDYSKTMKRDLLISILESASPKKHEDCGESSDDKLGETKHEDCGESSDDKLGEYVYKCLQGRKYLIVMDDIWSIEAWNDIQRSFSRECKGSKVLLTSRLPVQPDSVLCIPHYLNDLSKSCSWELLQKKVFGKKQCPLELVDIGKQIAEKCKGLPLAIVAIAGILTTEDKTLDVWEKVAKHLSSTIAKNQEGCMEILELSYNHLPLHLKACYLYIGAHPEDYEIPLRELIWLWIAEGFIQQSDGRKSLEAIAKDYLIGLLDRSLVMVARRSKSHGGIKTCRIHDLLRELCWKKAEEDNFFVRIYEGDSFSPSTVNKHRRLFTGHQFFKKYLRRLRPQNLRSFLYLSNSSCLQIDQDLSFIAENFKLLRVLHLFSPTIGEDIEKGDLVHLRYLASMSSSTLDYPESNIFDYFWNLEILYLKARWREEILLPRDIVKRVKLRHLYCKSGLFIYHGLFEVEGMLDSLQTLGQMCMCVLCLRFLKRTPNLIRLRLCGYREWGRMLPDLEFLKCLKKLYIEDARVTSTSWKLPLTLTQLTLRRTYLEWEELSIILQTLPSLEVLKLLYEACSGPVWNTSELEEGFFQLKYLTLEMLNIKEWNASEDQFPTLEVLVIRDCNLKRIPIEFANLNELRQIELTISCESLNESARKIQEEQRNTKGDDDCLNLVIRKCYSD